MQKIRTPTIDCLLVTACFFLASLNLHRSVWSNPALTGWDGVSHVAIAKDYVEHTWPDIFGWTPHWYLGMPFPNFYHPLFFWCVGFLHFVTRLPVETAMKGFVLALSTAMPTLFYFFCRKHVGGRWAGICGGLLCAFLMTRENPVSQHGITLIATYEIGLYAHLLGFFLLMLWLYVLPDARNSRKSFQIATALLALVLLANLNVLLNLALAFGAYLVLEGLWQREGGWRHVGPLVRTYGGMTLLALGIASVWYVPMLSTYRWVPTKPLEPPGPLVFPFLFFQLFVLFVFGGIAAYAKRNTLVFAFFLSSVALLVLIPLTHVEIFSKLPIQPFRNLITAMFLMIPVFTAFVSQIAELTNRAWIKILVVLFLPAALYFREPEELLLRSAATTYGSDEFKNLARAASDGARGRFLVEANAPYYHSRFDESWYLNGLAGSIGGFGLYSVYREASVASLFVDPFRNVYSTDRPGVYGIDARLADEPELFDQPMAEQRRRNRLFNLKYFFTTSEDVQRRLKSSDGFRKIQTSNGWELFEDTADMSRYAHVPKSAPYLVMSDLNLKRRRSIGGFDFLSLSEHALLRNEEEISLALHPSGRLDDVNPDDRRFSGLVVVDYRYSSLARAEERLRRYSEHHPVLFLKSDDPLFSKFSAGAEQGRVHVFAGPKAQPETDDNAKERKAWNTARDRLFDRLKQLRMAIEAAPEITSTEVGNVDFRVKLSGKPARTIPVILHQTYFPRWRAKDGETFLVNPCYQLVFTNAQEIEVRFKRDTPEYTGALISILCLGALVFAHGFGTLKKP